MAPLNHHRGLTVEWPAWPQSWSRRIREQLMSLAGVYTAILSPMHALEVQDYFIYNGLLGIQPVILSWEVLNPSVVPNIVALDFGMDMFNLKTKHHQSPCFFQSINSEGCSYGLVATRRTPSGLGRSMKKDARSFGCSSLLAC